MLRACSNSFRPEPPSFGGGKSWISRTASVDAAFVEAGFSTAELAEGELAGVELVEAEFLLEGFSTGAFAGFAFTACGGTDDADCGAFPVFAVCEVGCSEAFCVRGEVACAGIAVCGGCCCTT